MLGLSWGQVGPMLGLGLVEIIGRPLYNTGFSIAAQLEAKIDDAETFGGQLGPCWWPSRAMRYADELLGPTSHSWPMLGLS